MGAQHESVNERRCSQLDAPGRAARERERNEEESYTYNGAIKSPRSTRHIYKSRAFKGQIKSAFKHVEKPIKKRREIKTDKKTGGKLKIENLFLLRHT